MRLLKARRRTILKSPGWLFLIFVLLAILSPQSVALSSDAVQPETPIPGMQIEDPWITVEADPATMPTGGIVGGQVAPSYCNSSYKVALYARTDQWYVQPTDDANRDIAINTVTCTWQTTTTNAWERYAAHLVNTSYQHPSTTSIQVCPPLEVADNPDVLAAACFPAPRIIQFGGQDWTVKSGTGLDPANNAWSDDEASVSVDGDNKLHLKVREIDDVFYSAEVYTLSHGGYGLHRFYVDTPLHNLDPNVVFSVYFYDDYDIGSGDEFDIEIARWGNPGNPNNGQFILQPPLGNCPNDDHRLCFNLTYDGPTTHEILWTQNNLQFRIIEGHDPSTGTVLHEWIYPGNDFPAVSEKLNIHINLWVLNPPMTPYDAETQEIEVVLSDYEFIQVPSDQNLITNGDFSGGLDPWVAAGDMVASVSGGVLNFVRDASLGNGWALILQNLNQTTGANMPFEVKVDLGNTTNIDKYVSVYLHEDGTWAEGALGCTFVIPGNHGLETYSFQGTLPQAWDNITLEINALDLDTQPNYLLMDNVDVQYRPSLGSPADVCNLPTPPEGVNIVRNSGFSAGLSEWEVTGDMDVDVDNTVAIHRKAHPDYDSGSLTQSLNYAGTAGMPFEISIDMRNPFTPTRSVTLYIHEKDTWDEGALGCTFTLLQTSDPLRTYVVRGVLPADWSNITIEFSELIDSYNAFWIDNIEVRYTPELGNIDTTCYEPSIPVNTNVVRNGDFFHNADEWAIAGDMVGSVENRQLNFIRDSGQSLGWGIILQQYDHFILADSPFEVLIDLGNTTNVDKSVTVYLHEGGSWANGALGCVFRVPANTPPTIYMVRGTTPQLWESLVLEISTLDPDLPANHLVMDNVELYYKPSLGTPQDECVSVYEESTNFVRNGDFSDGLNEWAVAGDMDVIVIDEELNFVRDASQGNGWSLILQHLNQTANGGETYEIKLDLGNTSGAAKNVSVFLHEAGTWADGSVGCIFSIPANAPLETYIVQGTLPQAWDNITLEINSQSPDTAPNYLLMDNVQVRYKPELGNLINECIPYVPPNVNLVRNGDFSSDVDEWYFVGNISGTANDNVLTITKPTAGDYGSMIQHLNYAMPAGMPVEIRIGFGTPSDIGGWYYMEVYLHEAGRWEEGSLGCVIENEAILSPPRTFVIRGTIPNTWSNATLELRPNTVAPSHIANIEVRYKPELIGRPFECFKEFPEDTNLVDNGDFSDGLDYWEFPVSGSLTTVIEDGVLKVARQGAATYIFNKPNYIVPAESPLQITIDLGNESNVAKTVGVYTHLLNSWGGGNVGCTFVIPANSPLATYTIRGITSIIWKPYVFEMQILSTDSPPNYVLIDNVDVRYLPDLEVTGTECIEPAPPVVADAESGELSRIEAEDSQVVTASGDWIEHTSDAASGGAYMYSGGTENDTLSLNFSGTQITVIYVQHPALGSFDVYIDGEFVQTVSLTGVQNFGERVLIGDLPAGEHTLIIVPVGGVIAVDAFLVGTGP